MTWQDQAAKELADKIESDAAKRTRLEKAVATAQAAYDALGIDTDTKVGEKRNFLQSDPRATVEPDVQTNAFALSKMDMPLKRAQTRTSIASPSSPLSLTSTTLTRRKAHKQPMQRATRIYQTDCGPSSPPWR